MKKLVFLIWALLPISVASFAQNTPNQPQLYVTLGHISLFVDGKETSPVVTREDILANPTLMALPPANEVLGYKFRMVPGSKDAKLTEPIIVKGAELTTEIKQMLLNQKDARARIFIDEIRVKAGGGEMRARPILLVMQPKK
ncbi:MAG: hypothetical protein K0Q79_1819 [Flavipsychrobacter sp.]|jgi:hypothetical protein|nr:hypothetical protein [Flavipsychrobacter sp.]